MKEWQHKRAFVIQFQNESGVRADSFSGRIEHVASNRASHFQSLEEFLSFLHQVIQEVSRENSKEGLSGDIQNILINKKE